MHKSNISFSIIIPTRNRSELLLECILSVLNQTYVHFECIIIDDGSTDDTRAEVLKLADDRIKYFYQDHKERSSARNEGIYKAMNEFICFIDDDDFIDKNYLNQFRSAIEEDKYDKEILRVGFKRFKDSKFQTSVLFNEKEHLNFVNFALKNMCGVWSLCIPKEYLKSIKFPEEFPHWQDTYLILRLFSKYPVKQLGCHTYNYRIHGDMGSLKIKSEKHLSDRAEINVKAMSDFKLKYLKEIKPFVEIDVFDCIIAEKHLEYAVIAVLNGFENLGKKLLSKSLQRRISIAFWKHYVLYLRYKLF